MKGRDLKDLVDYLLDSIDPSVKDYYWFILVDGKRDNATTKRMIPHILSTGNSFAMYLTASDMVHESAYKDVKWVAAGHCERIYLIASTRVLDGMNDDIMKVLSFAHWDDCGIVHQKGDGNNGTKA